MDTSIRTPFLRGDLRVPYREIPPEDWAHEFSLVCNPRQVKYFGHFQPLAAVLAGPKDRYIGRNLYLETHGIRPGDQVICLDEYRGLKATRSSVEIAFVLLYRDASLVLVKAKFSLRPAPAEAIKLDAKTYRANSAQDREKDVMGILAAYGDGNRGLQILGGLHEAIDEGMRNARQRTLDLLPLHARKREFFSRVDTHTTLA